MPIYRMFATIVSWMVLRTRSDLANDSEILVLRHQLAALHVPLEVRRVPGTHNVVRAISSGHPDEVRP
jgi:hypothetical protein